MKNESVSEYSDSPVILQDKFLKYCEEYKGFGGEGEEEEETTVL